MPSDKKIYRQDEIVGNILTDIRKKFRHNDAINVKYIYMHGNNFYSLDKNYIGYTNDCIFGKINGEDVHMKFKDILELYSEKKLSKNKIICKLRNCIIDIPISNKDNFKFMYDNMLSEYDSFKKIFVLQLSKDFAISAEDVKQESNVQQDDILKIHETKDIKLLGGAIILPTDEFPLDSLRLENEGLREQLKFNESKIESVHNIYREEIKRLKDKLLQWENYIKSLEINHREDIKRMRLENDKLIRRTARLSGSKLADIFKYNLRGLREYCRERGLEGCDNMCKKDLLKYVLNSHNEIELRQICKSRNIVGYTYMTKPEMLRTLLQQ